MKKLIFLLLFLPWVAEGQSPVTHSAGSGVNVPSTACLACVGTEWVNEKNILAEDDSVSGTVLNPVGNCFQSVCFYSRYLYAHHFNFDIPADATIDSIFVDVRRAAGKANSVKDSIVQLQKSDTPVGKNLKSSVPWPASLTYENYGHKEPLWGTTWLPSEINDTMTGVALKIVNITSANAQAGIDHIQMTVYYSTSTGIFSVTSSPSEMKWTTARGDIDITMSTPSPVLCSSRIFNTTGQEVFSCSYGLSLTGENHFRCSAESLPDGIYFLIMNAGRKYYSTKIVVLR